MVHDGRAAALDLRSPQRPRERTLANWQHGCSSIAEPFA